MTYRVTEKRQAGLANFSEGGKDYTKEPLRQECRCAFDKRNRANSILPLIWWTQFSHDPLRGRGRSRSKWKREARYILLKLIK